MVENKRFSEIDRNDISGKRLVANVKKVLENVKKRKNQSKAISNLFNKPAEERERTTR